MENIVRREVVVLCVVRRCDGVAILPDALKVRHARALRFDWGEHVAQLELTPLSQ